jgi:hypothetical protein
VTFAGTDFKGAARPAGQERVTDPHPIRGGAAAPARDPAIALSPHQRARIAAHQPASPGGRARGRRRPELKAHLLIEPPAHGSGAWDDTPTCRGSILAPACGTGHHAAWGRGVFTFHVAGPEFILPVQPDGRILMSKSNGAFFSRVSLEARKARANRAAAVGITSLKGIASALEERRVPTPAGSGHWRAVQVRRLLARLAA